jgi:translation elongation factor P/translation initiation factor 5A
VKEQIDTIDIGNLKTGKKTRGRPKKTDRLDEPRMAQKKRQTTTNDQTIIAAMRREIQFLRTALGFRG